MMSWGGREYRIGVVGLGGRNRQLTEHWQPVPRVRLVAVADRTSALVDQTRAELGDVADYANSHLSWEIERIAREGTRLFALRDVLRQSTYSFVGSRWRRSWRSTCCWTPGCGLSRSLCQLWPMMAPRSRIRMCSEERR